MVVDKKKCVYKIVCKDKEITEFYIGSTNYFNHRKAIHKYNSIKLYRKEYCYPLYMFINVNGGWENWEMIVLEEFPNHTKKERIIEEQKYIDLLKPTLNEKNANGRDIVNRNNIRKINLNQKANCPQCGKEMLKGSIWRHINKKWCKNNIV